MVGVVLRNESWFGTEGYCQSERFVASYFSDIWKLTQKIQIHLDDKNHQSIHGCFGKHDSCEWDFPECGCTWRGTEAELSETGDCKAEDSWRIAFGCAGAKMHFAEAAWNSVEACERLSEYDGSVDSFGQKKIDKYGDAAVEASNQRLRSAGNNSNNTCNVNSDGDLNNNWNVNNTNNGVRPDSPFCEKKRERFPLSVQSGKGAVFPPRGVKTFRRGSGRRELLS